ncbi:hypothetical protein S40293_08110 [Stachybotrys chartarum IBT 40293]|nr:hypothetical protein S40293_08110 [Stachybotrys chartarum IBT 40293]
MQHGRGGARDVPDPALGGSREQWGKRAMTRASGDDNGRGPYGYHAPFYRSPLAKGQGGGCPLHRRTPPGTHGALPPPVQGSQVVHPKSQSPSGSGPPCEERKPVRSTWCCGREGGRSPAAAYVPRTLRPKPSAQPAPTLLFINPQVASSASLFPATLTLSTNRAASPRLAAQSPGIASLRFPSITFWPKSREAPAGPRALSARAHNPNPVAFAIGSLPNRRRAYFSVDYLLVKPTTVQLNNSLCRRNPTQRAHILRPIRPRSVAMELKPSLLSAEMSQCASPPASPPFNSSSSAFPVTMRSSRSLQTLMSAAPIDELPPSSQTQQPTPPMAYAPAPPRLRLNPRRRAALKTEDESPTQRMPVLRRNPPQGSNKRRRTVKEEEEDVVDDDDVTISGDMNYSYSDAAPTIPPAGAQDGPETQTPSRPSTPQRSRIAPEQLPLGVNRSDFHHLFLAQGGASAEPTRSGTDPEVDRDGQEWSVERDEMLTELLLAKMKLTKEDLEDCARSLGRSREAVQRRWKSLVAHGDIGVKRNRRRARLHSTWR